MIFSLYSASDIFFVQTHATGMNAVEPVYPAPLKMLHPKQNAEALADWSAPKELHM